MTVFIEIMKTNGKYDASKFWGFVAMIVFHCMSFTNLYENEGDVDLMQWVTAYCALHLAICGGEAIKRINREEKNDSVDPVKL